MENCTVDEGGNLISKGDDLKSENDKPGKRIKKKGKKDVVKSSIDAEIVDKISIFDDVSPNTIANDGMSKLIYRFSNFGMRISFLIVT